MFGTGDHGEGDGVNRPSTRQQPWRIPAAFGLLLVLGSLLMATAALAEDLRGKVVGIADGDTLTLLTERREQVRIRLSDIDAPERRQPYGTRARQMLADLAFGKPARIEVRDTDRYGRTVGRVFVAGQDLNAAMVRRGGAWVYRRYSDDAALLPLEREAQMQRRGLWSLPEAERVPPWEWRAVKREHREPASPASR